ncbi:MAG: hypothetical protein U1F54_12440 [Burkholderiales bacterium]
MHNENDSARRIFGVVAMAAALAMPAFAQAQVTSRLGSYNVDPAMVSVSGHSSGANMAIQLGVAYASRIMGVAAFAGQPYDCLRPGNITSNNCAGTNVPDIAPLRDNMLRWSGKENDPVEALARQRIYVFVGKHDLWTSGTVIGRTVDLYRFFVPEANLKYEAGIDAPHAIPTDADIPRFPTWQCAIPGIPGSSVGIPLVNCGYDGAGVSLRWIYGSLAPRATGARTGTLLAVDQGEFVSRAKGMDSIAWLYVPKSCAEGATCKLHVFLHACGQSYFARQDTVFVDSAGHVPWADANGIVLLYPQTYPDTTLNPAGCWDDQNVYDAKFDQKAGVQASAIMAMVTRITSGFAGTVKAVEYYHAAFGHYFVTSLDDEIAAIDAGKAAGWVRTGESFGVYAAGTPGKQDVCRFFSGEYYVTVSSHFYTTNAAECASLMTSRVWQYEGVRFALTAPDATGGCAGSERPLYRLYNGSQGGVPNHRYTTSLSTRASMIAAGWIPEGNGDLGVIGCTPL